jgi:uncharacterized membrane protein
MLTKTLAVVTVLFCAFLGAIAQTLFKIGSKDIDAYIVRWIFNSYIVVGFLLYGISSIGFIYSLKSGDLSLLYPLIATSYIWVTVFAVWFLGEQMPSSRLVGIFLLIIGVFLITSSWTR